MVKKIEEKYKEMSEIEHILNRPGMWVGSTKNEEKDFFIYCNENGKMSIQALNYIPGMLKVVDEVISNSCDEYRRKDNMGLNKLVVTIHKDSNIIEVFDNGGIPIVKHSDAGIYIPEFIFGRLRTSSNYDDSEDRMVIGTNGVGSALCNVFSKKFTIESADGKNKYHRSWSNNMQVLNDDLKVEKCKDHFTKTTFELDINKFDTSDKTFTTDFINIIHKRCIDAAVANIGLDVTFKVFNKNKEIINENWKFKSFNEYLDLYSDFINIKESITFTNDICQAYIFPDSNIDIAFVNGAECSKGTHIRTIRTDINAAVSEFLNKKDKIDLSPRSVDNKYSVFCNIDVVNPAYDSQTKDTLTTPVDRFIKDPKKKWEIPETFFKDIVKSEIVESVRDWYKQKQAAEDQKTLRKLNSEAKKGLKRPDKYITCSSKKKSDRELWIFEGDSARSGFRNCRVPEKQAGYTMRGVPLNCYDMTPVQIMKNEVFNDLITIIGLKWGKDFNINDLNFGRIVLASDQDFDGYHINGLLLAFFNNWPELFEKGIIVRSESPIIIARKGKDCKFYYNVNDFKQEEKKLKGYTFKYAKGLGGLNQEETRIMYQQPHFTVYKKDNLADNIIRKWFLKGDSETRKELLQ